MDARLTSEQRQLRDAAARLAGDLGPGSVHDLADADRVARLEKAVDSTGWRALRSDGASGVEVAIVAEEFARRLVDVPFLGPVLADELCRHVAGDVPSCTIAVDAEAVDTRGLRRALMLTDHQVLAGGLGPPVPGDGKLVRELVARAGGAEPELAWAAVQTETLRLHVRRRLSERLDAVAHGPEGSLDKLLMTWVEQSVGHAALAVAGTRDADLLGAYLYSRAQSVMGGTSQIQKNIIASLILGLGA